MSCRETIFRLYKMFRIFKFMLAACYFCSIAAGASLSLLPTKDTHFKFGGDAFYVQCTAEGESVQRLMWTGPNGRQITSQREKIRVEAGVEQPRKGLGINFDKIELQDKGKYTCSASVDGRNLRKAFQLNVIDPIDFKDTNPDQHLIEGKNSPLKCNVGGNPRPKISWKRNEKLIKPRPGKKYSPHPDNKDWIVVNKVTMHDMGEYTCHGVQLTEATSDLKSFDINVKVHHKPKPPMPEPVSKFHGYVTGEVNLTCSAVAEPRAKFIWTDQRNRRIRPSENIKIYDENRRSNLEIQIKDERVFGDYYCEAANDLGRFKRVITLLKGKKPPKPTAEIKSVRSDGFILNMTAPIDPEMPVTGFIVEYKRESEGDSWERANRREFERGRRYVLDGLQGSTLYTLRVSSKNIAGHSDHSEQMKMKTKKGRAAKLSGGAGIMANLVTVFLLTLITKVTAHLY